MKNGYDIICMALKSAPQYIDKSDLLTTNLCSRYGVDNEADKLTVRNIVTVALDAATTGDFRKKAEFILAQTLNDLRLND